MKPPVARTGHFKHRHPGNCKACDGDGFLLKMVALPPMNPGPAALHPVRCSACKGTGWQ